jgi:hypothetical protein
LVVEKEPPVTTLPAKDPFESLRTIVLAPFELDAVVRALTKVPEVTFEALIAVRATPLPDTDVKVPVAALTVVAVKVPLTVKLPAIPDNPLTKLVPSQ